MQGDPGHSPYHRDPVTFYAHRLGTDHAEGLAAIDMNGDGLLDITSGAYWYENPGPAGGEWKRHKFRQLAPELPSGASSGRKTRLSGTSSWRTTASSRWTSITTAPSTW